MISPESQKLLLRLVDDIYLRRSIEFCAVSEHDSARAYRSEGISSSKISHAGEGWTKRVYTQSTSEGECLHVKQLHPSWHTHAHIHTCSTPPVSLLRATSPSLSLTHSLIRSPHRSIASVLSSVFFSSSPLFLPFERRTRKHRHFSKCPTLTERVYFTVYIRARRDPSKSRIAVEHPEVPSVSETESILVKTYILHARDGNIETLPRRV